MSATKPSISRAIALAAEALGCAASNLDRYSQLGSIPAWDSLGQLDIMLHLEDKVGLNLEEVSPEALFSIAGIAEVIGET